MMSASVFDVISREIFNKEKICNSYLRLCKDVEFEKVTVEDYAIKILK